MHIEGENSRYAMAPIHAVSCTKLHRQSVQNFKAESHCEHRPDLIQHFFTVQYMGGRGEYKPQKVCSVYRNVKSMPTEVLIKPEGSH